MLDLVRTRVELTRDEQRLLLFLETCAVDHGGRVDVRHMNADDMATARRWNEGGLVEFGRIVAADHVGHGTHWCHLSAEAWTAAELARHDRADRMWANRKYARTCDREGR